MMFPFCAISAELFQEQLDSWALLSVCESVGTDKWNEFLSYLRRNFIVKYKPSQWSKIKIPITGERGDMLSYSNNSAEAVNKVVDQDLPKTRTGSLPSIAECVWAFSDKQACRYLQLNTTKKANKLHRFYKSLWRGIQRDGSEIISKILND